MESGEVQDKSLKTKLTEDHWALIVAGFIILVVAGISVAGIPLPVKAPVYSWTTFDEIFSKVFSSDNLLNILLITIVFLVLVSFAAERQSILKYISGFLVLILFALISLILAGNKSVGGWGIEYVVFALLIGIFIRNAHLASPALLSVARSELYIKTGLIILGTSVLFTDIVKAGVPGILQAIIVVLVVWFASMWISKKLNVDDEFAVMIASAVSICGVSAAIVASGAIQGDKKKLSYVTTLVLVVAIPMLVLQPWIIKYFNIPEIIGGAWLGGTLDTTASVTAASQIVGPIATKAGVIVKFSQNVLIGVAALFISMWWAYRTKSNSESKPGLRIIWERFPKFVLGFLAASILFSFFLSGDTLKQTSGFLNALRTLWFALAFVSIGLEANFKELFMHNGKAPALAFVWSQLFNIVWTLIWAFILFGGYLFSIPDLK